MKLKKKNYNQELNQFYDKFPIEKIFIINLDHRNDRLQHVLNELQKVSIPKKIIQRISAIQDPNGAIGCTKSHILCLDLANQNNYKNVLILEDDFTINNSTHFTEFIFYLINNPNFSYNVICLNANIIKQIEYNQYFNRLIESQTTSAYLVNNNYYLKLLNNFKEGLLLFQKHKDKYNYAIDIYWKSLQLIDSWFAFKKKIGYQYKNYSDIEKRIIFYNV